MDQPQGKKKCSSYFGLIGLLIIAFVYILIFFMVISQASKPNSERPYNPGFPEWFYGFVLLVVTSPVSLLSFLLGIIGFKKKEKPSVLSGLAVVLSLLAIASVFFFLLKF